MNGKIVGLAAVLSAGFASICCIGPLALSAVGLGSLGLAAGLTRYRPLFLAVTAVVLGAGFYYAYRKRSTACAGGCPGARAGSKAAKTGLWGLTALAAALATFPNWSACLLSRKAASAPATAKTLTLNVAGMTCAACAASIEKAVEKVPGVYSARVDFDEELAVIETEDGVDAGAVLKAVEAAGYHARIDSEGGDG